MKKSKKIGQLIGEDGIVELETRTIIRIKGDTVHLETYIYENEAYGQRISWMKDQPLVVLKRTQISTQ